MKNPGTIFQEIFTKSLMFLDFPSKSMKNHYKNSGTHELGLPKHYKNNGTHELSPPKHYKTSSKTGRISPDQPDLLARPKFRKSALDFSSSMLSQIYT